MKKVWFITGISSGFGKVLTEIVSKSGDIVVGTFRKKDQVDAFNNDAPKNASAVLLDVTHEKQISAAIDQVVKQHGRIDVLVNNAGYGLLGAIEEVSMDELRHQMETNFFGAWAVTQKVLPIMRKQKSGHIFQISSIAGMLGTGGAASYNASKFAMEGFSQALAQEVAPLNIKVTVVSPGPFRTDFTGRSLRFAKHQIDDYHPTAGMLRTVLKDIDGKQPGDPQKAAQLIFEVANSKNPPLNLPLGQIAINDLRTRIKEVEKDVSAWEEKSLQTSF